MPYKMFKDSKGKFCVKNSDTGESKGCSDSRASALGHLRALYAVEGGEKMGKKALGELLTKAIDDYNAEYSDDQIGMADLIEQVEYDLPEEVSVVEEVKPTRFSSKAKEFVKNVSDWFNSWREEIEKIEKDEVKKEECDDCDKGDLMVWKEIDTDQYRWFGRFSNNFRDEDKPPEIISEASHKYFLDRVEKGLAPMPTLRVWHVPEWTIGQADWLAYDDAGNDAGFTLASGTFTKGLDDVAEWLLGQKKVLMSHGMPPWSIKYDSTDPSIIVQHESKEVSVLPDFAAANKLTGFAVLAMEEDMAIPKDKKDILINQWKADPAMLDRLEAMNVKVASLAKEAGLESKEQATKEETVENEVKVATETANTEEVVTQTTDTTVAPATTTPTDFPTRQEIVEAVAAILTPMAERLDALETSIDGFTKAVKELQKDQDEQVKQTIDNTPAASLSALIMQRVVGNPDAELDGRKSLAKSKPQETPVNNRTIGVPFLDNMLSGSNH